MALINVKGRQDSIRISNEDARDLKEKWMSTNPDGSPKFPRNMIVDLGEWAGELREVKSIVLEEEPKENNGKNFLDLELQEQARKEERERFNALSPEEKFKERESFILEGFKMKYRWAHDRKDPPEETLQKFKEVVVNFYRENPTESYVPPEVYRHLEHE